jgi:hypothetical protein
MGKAERSSPLGKPRRRRNDSIKTDVKDTYSFNYNKYDI